MKKNGFLEMSVDLGTTSSPRILAGSVASLSYAPSARRTSRLGGETAGTILAGPDILYTGVRETWYPLWRRPTGDFFNVISCPSVGPGKGGPSPAAFLPWTYKTRGIPTTSPSTFLGLTSAEHWDPRTPPDPSDLHPTTIKQRTIALTTNSSPETPPP